MRPPRLPPPPRLTPPERLPPPLRPTEEPREDPLDLLMVPLRDLDVGLDLEVDVGLDLDVFGL